MSGAVYRVPTATERNKLLLQFLLISVPTTAKSSAATQEVKIVKGLITNESLQVLYYIIFLFSLTFMSMM